MSDAVLRKLLQIVDVDASVIFTVVGIAMLFLFCADMFFSKESRN